MSENNHVDYLSMIIFICAFTVAAFAFWQVSKTDEYEAWCETLSACVTRHTTEECSKLKRP